MRQSSYAHRACWALAILGVGCSSTTVADEKSASDGGAGAAGAPVWGGVETSGGRDETGGSGAGGWGGDDAGAGGGGEGGATSGGSLGGSSSGGSSSVGDVAAGGSEVGGAVDGGRETGGDVGVGGSSGDGGESGEGSSSGGNGGEGGAPPLEVTLAPLPDATFNVDYSTTLIASGGGDLSYELLSPTDVGLTLSSDGVLAGRPTRAGTLELEIAVHDGERGTVLQVALDVIRKPWFAFRVHSGTSGGGTAESSPHFSAS